MSHDKPRNPPSQVTAWAILPVSSFSTDDALA